MIIFVDDETGEELIQQLESQNITHQSFPGNSTLTDDQFQTLSGAILYFKGAGIDQLANKIDSIVVTEMYRELEQDEKLLR